MAPKKTLLNNGITILTEHIKHVRSISIGVWITAGSIDENIDNRGIAHFLEHMLFKGTATRDKHEIAHFLESKGGSLNAFTSKEFTCIYARVLSELLPESIDIIADLIQNSTFPEKEIQKESSVVLDEINDLEDSPGDIIFEKFYENIFPEHPLGYPILGYKEDINKIDKQKCKNFIKNQYTPNRIIITASGYLNHNELVDLVNKYFIKLGNNKSKRQIIPFQSINKKKNIYKHKSNNQTHICTGTRIVPYNSNKRISFLMLNSILSAGMSSRLYQNIREKHGICYDLHSFTDFFEQIGCFYIYASTANKNSNKCLDLLRKEINTIIEKPVFEYELSTTKELLKSSLVIGLESTTTRMNRLARQFIYTHKIESIDRVIEKIESITTNDIQNITKEYLNPDNFVTTILKS